MTSTPTFSEHPSALAPESGDRRLEQLADLQAITDASLSRLAHDELLTALLQRVTKIVDADTTTPCCSITRPVCWSPGRHSGWRRKYVRACASQWAWGLPDASPRTGGRS